MKKLSYLFIQNVLLFSSCANRQNEKSSLEDSVYFETTDKPQIQTKKYIIYNQESSSITNISGNAVDKVRYTIEIPDKYSES